MRFAFAVEAEKLDRFSDVRQGIGCLQADRFFSRQGRHELAQVSLGFFKAGATEDEVAVHDDLRTITSRVTRSREA